MKRLGLAVVVLCLLPASAFADDVYDILKKLPIQRPDNTTQTLNSSLYAASVTMNLQDRDGNNFNFADGDIMRQLVLSSMGGILSFPMGTTADIDQFARDHTKQIIAILFPSGIASNTLGQSENQLNSSLVFDEVVTPIKSPRSSQRKQLKNELSGRLEYNRLELNNSDGNAVGTLLSYRRDIANRFEIGLLVPYRYTSLNDPADTTAHFSQFDFYGTYIPYDGDLTIRIGADAFTSILVSQSNVIDILGDLTYGGSIFSSIEKDFKFFIISFGLGFQVSKTTLEFLPSTSGILGNIINTLNDRDVDQDLTYGLNIGIPYGENFIINLGVNRTNSFASDISSSRNAQTKVRAVAQYKISNMFELNGGYSTILEIKDFTTNIFFISAIGRF
jgi:hypothetical protein